MSFRKDYEEKSILAIIYAIFWNHRYDFIFVIVTKRFNRKKSMGYRPQSRE